MTEHEYQDALTLPAAYTNMWSQVLIQAMHDATKGMSHGKPNRARHLREIEEARSYILTPNRGFNEVCYLAGLDPVAVRERAAKLIAASPSPEQLAGIETVQ